MHKEVHDLAALADELHGGGRHRAVLGKQPIVVKLGLDEVLRRGDLLLSLIHI